MLMGLLQGGEARQEKLIFMLFCDEFQVNLMGL